MHLACSCGNAGTFRHTRHFSFLLIFYVPSSSPLLHLDLKDAKCHCVLLLTLTNRVSPLLLGFPPLLTEVGFWRTWWPIWYRAVVMVVLEVGGDAWLILFSFICSWVEIESRLELGVQGLIG